MIDRRGAGRRYVGGYKRHLGLVHYGDWWRRLPSRTALHGWFRREGVTSKRDTEARRCFAWNGGQNQAISGCFFSGAGDNHRWTIS